MPSTKAPKRKGRKALPCPDYVKQAKKDIPRLVAAAKQYEALAKSSRALASSKRAGVKKYARRAACKK